MTKYVLAIMAVVVASLGLFPSSASADDMTLAEFEGGVLNIAESWGEAAACHVGEGLAVTCFRSESEMDDWLSTARIAGLAAPFGPMPAASCSGFLRLYDGISYSGTVLNLSSRGSILNLASFNFDQRTSSYKVGSCNATFYDYASGGGSVYPTSLTQAYDQAGVMLSGWDNDVSSVFIH